METIVVAWVACASLAGLIIAIGAIRYVLAFRIGANPYPAYRALVSGALALVAVFASYTTLRFTPAYDPSAWLTFLFFCLVALALVEAVLIHILSISIPSIGELFISILLAPFVFYTVFVAAAPYVLIIATAMAATPTDKLRGIGYGLFLALPFTALLFTQLPPPSPSLQTVGAAAAIAFTAALIFETCMHAGRWLNTTLSRL